MYELTTQFMLNAKPSPLKFIKELRKYKAAVKLEINQYLMQPTLCLILNKAMEIR